MKNRSLSTLLVTMVGLATVIAGVQITAECQEKLRQQQSIEGTWRTVVTPVNCETKAPVGPSFPGLLAFARGGTLSGTSTAVPSAYGVWNRESGQGNYTFAFTSLRYNSSGVYIGSQVVRQYANLTQFGTSLVSVGTVAIFDVDGNQIGAGCANATGTRFE